MPNVVFARRCPAAGGIEYPVVADFRAVVVDAEDGVGAVVEGSGELVVRCVLGVVTADHDFVLHGQRVEVADEVHVQAELGGVEIGHEIGVLHAAAVGFQAIAAALQPLVFRLVAFRHAHGADLEGPVVVEVVLKIGVDGGDIDVRMVPARAGVSGARHIEGAAVGIARQAADHRARLGIGVADCQAQGGVLAQVEVQRTVQRVGLAPFVVDERVTLVFVGDETPTNGAGLVQGPAGVQLQAVVIPGTGLAGDRHGRGVLAALAHQVDRAAGAAGALQQAGGAAQHFHAIEEDQVLGGPVTQRVGVARDRHAVVLPVIDLETA
ncbi:hypothetical protein D3C84_373530 [compost metagenome]